VSVHLTEEEQFEMLKRWWADNGRSIVIGVVLAVGAYFGWQGWEGQQQKNAAAAAFLFEDLTQAMTPEGDDSISDEQRTTAFSIVDELKEKYSGGLYAGNGALFAAQLAAEQGDMERAAEELRWVLEHHDGEPLGLVARQRLAQVHFDGEEYTVALDLLEVDDIAGFESQYAELRGDIYLTQEDYPQAESAFQEAMDTLLPTQNNRRSMLQMKINAVQSFTAREYESAPAADSAAEQVETPEPETAAEIETVDAEGAIANEPTPAADEEVEAQ